MARNRDIELNALFGVPPSVVDVRQENKDDGAHVYTSDSLVAEAGPVLEYSDSPIPNAPSGYTILSQTIRISPDGGQVVDVLLEFPDVGVEIDVRVTPA